MTEATELSVKLAETKLGTDKLKARAALAAALAKAQGAFLPIAKNRSVEIRSEKGPYRFEYADLEVIIAATRQALAANGLSVVQSIGSSADGRSYLDTVVLHSEGGELVSRIPLPALGDYRDPKQFGAALMYLRRYSYSAMLCVAADDDLDADGQEARGSTTRPASSPEPRKAAPRRTPAQSAEQPPLDAVTEGQRNWLKKKLAGREDGQDLLAKHNLAAIDGTLTLEQFAAMKSAVMA